MRSDLTYSRLIGSLCLMSFMLVAYYRPYPFQAIPTPIESHSGFTTMSGEAMTLDYHITFGTTLNDGQKQRAEDVICTTFKEIHDTCNQWNPHSVISQCNQMSANNKREIPPLLENLLLTANEIVTLTNGKYDPTIEPLKAIWVKSLRKGQEPPQAELAAISPQIGWHKLHVEKRLLWKEHDLLALNLDSIAKGLCVDLLTERLVAEGFSDVLVEWGGELRAAGQHPEKRPWQLFIRRLTDDNPAHALAIVTLDNAALATSGDYLQHWTLHIDARNNIDDSQKTTKDTPITYFHVFNPHTLRPLSMHPGSIASVTVRAPSCALADALATAGMLCADLDEAREWAHTVQEQFPDTSFWFAARK